MEQIPDNNSNRKKKKSTRYGKNMDKFKLLQKIFMPNTSLNFCKRHKNEYVIIITINCWVYNRCNISNNNRTKDGGGKESRKVSIIQN